MPKKEIKLKKLSKSKVMTFKIKNRSGFAALCMNNLTEGPTNSEAVRRMAKAVKRQGYLLK